jgi:hypothetical protein
MVKFVKHSLLGLWVLVILFSLLAVNTKPAEAG